MAAEFHQVIDQAISWHVRMQAAGTRADDWDAFTEWLESDPINADAYDRIALADADLGGLASDSAWPATEALAQPASRRGWSSWRLAPFAAAAALLFAVMSWPQAADPELRFFATAPGETRTIALGGGTRVELNGDTRVSLDMKTARFARLDRGEATFVVRHDAADPFVLEAGGHRLLDTGTVFNVALSATELNVGVAQGSVLFEPDGAGIALPVGRTLRLDKASSRIELGRQAPAAIGSWRDGRLVYSNAPLTTIASDVARAIGKPVTVDAAVRARRFTGVIVVDGDERAVFRRIAALLDVQARHSSKGWSLSS